MVDDDFDEGPIRDDADESGASLDAATGEDGIPCPEGAGKPALKTPAAAEAACCVVCEKKVLQRWLACTCGARAHVECLAQHYIQARHLPPSLYTSCAG